MTDSLKQARLLVDATVVAQEYMGSDAIRSVIGMLEALEENYKSELADVLPADLVALQTKLKQTQAIRKALTKETPLPRI